MTQEFDLDALAAADLLGAIDVHLAATLQRLVPQTSTLVALSAALASRAVQQGHVCVDLRRQAGHPLAPPEGHELTDMHSQSLPAFGVWQEALLASPLVATSVDPLEPRPLVLDPQGRLYLYRYAAYQHRLAAALRARAPAMEAVNATLLADGLRRLFGPQAHEQKQAAAVAVLRRFSVISGGPGTGKTFTVARILALLQEQALATQSAPYRVKALAPTGKAAQRLAESMATAVAALDVSAEVRQAVLTPTSTIHRALGYLPQTPTRFRHTESNPLPADVVLVDEASMVDLALMSKLLAAVPAKARLILLGDKDQLASVEAGSILSDIYGTQAKTFSSAMATRMRQIGIDVPSALVDPQRPPGLVDGCIALSRSRRYADDSGIGAVARAVNASNAEQALALAQTSSDVRLLPPLGNALPETLRNQLMHTFAGIATAQPHERLAMLSRLKVLCAHRRGPTGAEWVNPQVESWLAAHDVIRPTQLWYDGRPVLITANDPVLELYNGDVGVICLDATTGVPLAHFASMQGNTETPAATRTFAPARLPAHETVFAMTVHKSQGSEFDQVALLLPEKVSHVLTRELLYTAITRAKHKVDIYASPEVFTAAVELHVERVSGLRDELQGC